MALSRHVLLTLITILLIGCGPGIRFMPGEIPTPNTSAPEHLAEGQQIYQHMLHEMPVLRDSQAVRRVSRILDKLLNVTPTTGHWTVTLIDNPAFNAMTTPGKLRLRF